MGGGGGISKPLVFGVLKASGTTIMFYTMFNTLHTSPTISIQIFYLQSYTHYITIYSITCHIL